MGKLNNDIEKYLNGELSPAEMHALEQQALQDPFLAEALEGAEMAGPENFSLDIATLQKSIKEKSRRRIPKTIGVNWWGMYSGIAAGLAIIAVSAYIIFLSIRHHNRTAEIALLKKSEKQERPSQTQNPVLKNNDAYITSDDHQKPTPSVTRGKTSDLESTSTLSDDRDDLTAGPIAQPPLERVSNEDFAPRQNEREVEVELSEPPVIVSDQATEDVVAEEIAEKKEEPARARKVIESVSAPYSGTSISSSPGGEKVITGRITDDSGQSLPGVNVLVKGTTHGTVSDADGKYQITVPASESTLVYNFIGYQTHETSVKNSEVLNVALNPEVMALSEVVVTGYSRSYEPSVEPEFEMAEPTGGRRAFNEYLQEQMQYPKEALDKKIEGKVTVQFTVEPTGELTEFKIVKGLGYGCDEELIRLIKQGPPWLPSKRNNQPVKERVKVRVKFELPE